ncbi:hypothetical protein D3C72_469090 [compost metagenome]
MTLPLDCLLYSKTNLIGIGPNLSDEERLDVQTLLDHADEFASRFLDRDELWKSWFDRFRNRLEKHGCVRTAALELPPQVIRDHDDFDTRVEPIGTGSTPTLLAQLARASMQELRISAHASKFLQSGWQNDVASSFLITPCQKDEEGQIHLAVYSFRFNGTVEMRDVSPLFVSRFVRNWATGGLAPLPGLNSSHLAQAGRSRISRPYANGTCSGTGR